MTAKFVVVLLVAINCYSSCGGALRRTPKVYNALITTDDNLTSSRAYPVIQPTIHETGLAHAYPFGPYNHYGYYSPPLVRFGQPIAPGLTPREQLPYPLAQPQFPPQMMPRPHYPYAYPGYPAPHMPTAPAEQETQEAEPMQKEAPGEEPQPVKPPTEAAQPEKPAYIPMEENRPEQMPNGKVPLPLNEYGLPPSLIPLPQYHNRQRRPVNLPPYGFNQFPVIYDPVSGLRQQFLPPYDYFPGHTYALRGPGPRGRLPFPTAAPTAAPDIPSENETSDDEQMTTEPEASVPPTEAPSFDSIKNGSKSKNSDVPDVPPPPIPSGGKSV